MPRIFLLCAILVLAAPAFAADSEVRNLRGTVSSLSGDSITITRGDRTLRCTIDGRSPSVGKVRAGHRVSVACRRVQTRLVLRRFSALNAPDRVALVESSLVGNVTARGAGTVAVGNDRGRVLKCTVPAGFGGLVATVAAVTIGDPVVMVCRGGKLISITKADAAAPPSATPTPVAASAPTLVTTPTPVAAPAPPLVTTPTPAATPTPVAAPAPTLVTTPTPATTPTPVAAPAPTPRHDTHTRQHTQTAPPHQHPRPPRSAADREAVCGCAGCGGG